MGSCASVHKYRGSSMKIRFPLCCNTKKLLLENGEHPVSEFKSQSSPLPPVTKFQKVGSKEETFFDSQAWLESDCDDDFLSVNGDFTPSRGNTPNYESSFIATPQRTKSPFLDRTPDSLPEPSPTSKKKRLSELFQESFGGDEFSNETPYISGVSSVCSRETTPSKDNKSEMVKLPRQVQCCLPILTPSRRLKEKKIADTVNNGGG